MNRRYGGDGETTVGDALRRAWAQLPDAVRNRYASRQYGDAMPNKRITESVLPQIFPRDAGIYDEARKVCKVVNWPQPISEHAAAQVAERVASHVPHFTALHLWRAGLLRQALALGVGLPKDDGPIQRAAMLAACQSADPSEPEAEAAAEAIGRVVRTNLVDARTTAQLEAALDDEATVARVEAILDEWRTPVPRLDEELERRAWTATCEDALSLLSLPAPTSARDKRVREVLSPAWAQFSAGTALRGFDHATRAAEMGLADTDVVADRHPRPRLGGPPPRDPLPRPLDRTLFERVHRLVGSGNEARRSALPPIDDLLCRAAAQALEPFSLSLPESRYALVLAYVLSSRIDPDAKLGTETLLDCLLWRLLSPLARLSMRTAAAGAGQLLVGETGSIDARRRDTDEEAPSTLLFGAVTIDNLSPAALDRSRIAFYWSRIGDLLERSQEDLVQRLWVALHNRGLSVPRPRDEARPGGLEYGDVHTLLFDVANKVAKDAVDKARNLRPAAQEGAEKAAAQGPGPTGATGLAPDQILPDVLDILKRFVDYREFVPAVEPEERLTAYLELLELIVELDSSESSTPTEAQALAQLRDVATCVWRAACIAAEGRLGTAADTPIVGPTLEALLGFVRRSARGRRRDNAGNGSSR